MTTDDNVIQDAGSASEWHQKLLL